MKTYFNDKNGYQELPDPKSSISKKEVLALAVPAITTTTLLLLHTSMPMLGSLTAFILLFSIVTALAIAYRHNKAVTITWLIPFALAAAGTRLSYIKYDLSGSLLVILIAAVLASFLYIKLFYYLYPHHQTKYKNKSETIAYLTLLLCTVALAAFFSKMHFSMVSSSFLIALPLLTGLFIALFAHINQPSTTFAHIFQLCTQNFIMFIIIAIFLLQEGIICLVMASPILLILLLLGGGIGHILCKIGIRPKSNLPVMAALPLLLLLPKPQANTQYSQTHKDIIIDAPVEAVWEQINHINDIKSEELGSHFIYNIGVPKPISGMTVEENNELVRKIYWEKNIHFEEHITEYIPNQKISWKFHFDQTSFPSYALDEHVTIGGEYFDLLKTSYTLSEYGANKTKLGIDIHYRLSTNLNWYAEFWAKTSLNSFSNAVLELYQHRLENKVKS